MEFDYEYHSEDGASSSPTYFSTEIHYAEMKKAGDGGSRYTCCAVQYLYVYIWDDAAAWDKYWTLDGWSSFARHALKLSDLQRILFRFTAHQQMREFILRYGSAFSDGISGRLSFGHDVCWVFDAARDPDIPASCSK